MSIELSWSKFKVANLEYVGIIIFSVDDNLESIRDERCIPLFHQGAMPR